VRRREISTSGNDEVFIARNRTLNRRRATSKFSVRAMAKSRVHTWANATVRCQRHATRRFFRKKPPRPRCPTEEVRPQYRQGRCRMRWPTSNYIGGRVRIPVMKTRFYFTSKMQPRVCSRTPVTELFGGDLVRENSRRWAGNGSVFTQEEPEDQRTRRSRVRING